LNKRALMLTAATAALMSGPAFATCPTTPPTWTTISTQITVPVDTACADSGNPGTITIATDGSVVVSTSPYTVPAVTIDSGTMTSPGNVTNAGTISYNGVSSSTGVELLANGNVGGLDNQDLGTIELTGSGTSKIGILVGLLPTATTGTFTGGVVPAAAIAYLPTNLATDPIAIYLENGSTLNVVGTTSYGIETLAGSTLVGDIDIGGTVEVEPSSTTSTSGGNTAIFINGAIGTTTQSDSIVILPGATVEATGPGSEGLVVAAPATGPSGVNGAIINFGAIEAIGTTTPVGGTSTTDAEGGSALSISANITGGIYNAGPNTVGNSVASATITTQGDAPAVNITTADLSSGAAPVTIGVYNDPTDPTDSIYSFLNRGSISASGTDVNVAQVTAISISGTSQTADVTLTGGIFDSGSISASNANDDTGTPNGATAISITNFVSVPELVTNKAESSDGLISASVSGPNGGTAYGIYVGANASLPTIVNYGTIAVVASTTEPTISTLVAEAIVDRSGPNINNIDESGTITSITNYGTISATTCASLAGGPCTALDNDDQIARAIDLYNSTQTITVTNNGTIQGDIVLGVGQNTLTDTGSGPTPASITGNVYFGGQIGVYDQFTIGEYGTFTGAVIEGANGKVTVDVQGGGAFNLTNSYLPVNSPSGPSASSPYVAAPLIAHDFTIENDANWSLTLSQPFNLYGVNPNNTNNSDVGAIIQADDVSIGTSTVANFKVNFGSFITSPSSITGPGTAQFALISAPQGDFTVSTQTLTAMSNDITVPFLFQGTGATALCTQNIPGSPINCVPGTVEPSALSEIDLVLQPKTPQQLDLTGYALKMFPYVNQALANDTQLGSGVVAGITSNVSAQQVYSSFAPDVTGATRATAIALTDSATNVVAERQRELNMYANQEGDTTLWGQEFVQRLDQDSTSTAIGYTDSGFGFALGTDTGDPADGRYGAAFTFFSGGSSTHDEVISKTAQEFYMATFYTNWRGRGLFFDSQVTAGWAHLASERFIDVGGVSRVADGDRPAAILAGGVTTGGVFNFGSTVMSPQLSIDGLTMREDGYSEGGGEDITGGDGFDLRIQPYYANSARAFLGIDMRQDINLGDFYLQPEARVGYRYDMLDGAEKLEANFVGVTPIDQFSITGPDPAKGNIVLGGGLAVTTGAWSVGVHYDFLRSDMGNSQQDGMLTLVGRI